MSNLLINRRVIILLILLLCGTALFIAFSTAASAFAPQPGNIRNSGSSPIQIQNPPDLLTLDSPDSGIKLLRSDESGLLLEIYAPEFRVSEIQTPSGSCQVIYMDGYTSSGSPGSPELPVNGFTVGIPPGTIPTLTVLNSEYVNLPQHYDICLATEPIVEIGIDGQIQFRGFTRTNDPLMYASDRFEPSTPAELVSIAYLRSQPLAQIRIQPFQYNPVTGQLRYIRHLHLRLDYSNYQLRSQLSSSFTDEGQFEEILQNALLNYDQARAWRLPSNSNALLFNSQFDPPEPAYKLLVDQDGIYQVSYADLQAAGFPVDILNPQTFQMFNQGTEIAIYVAGEGDTSFNPSDYLLFYGQGVDTKYTNTNVYWLTWGNAVGLRMDTKDGTPSGFAAVPEHHLSSKHLEEDFNYQSSRSSGSDNDHWYWDYIYATGSPVYKTFTTTLSYPTSTPISATVRGLFKGYTATPQHHTLVYLNGHVIDDSTWAAEAEFSFDVDIPQSYLQDGINAITVECPMDGGISLDVPLFNWFEIDYHRAYTVENNVLAFNGVDSGTWEFQLSDFYTDILEIYDVTNPLTPTRILNAAITPESGTYTLAFEDSLVGESHYLALSVAQRLSPISIIADNPSDLQDLNNGADYIIITHADFYTDVQSLADFRAAQGMRTLVVDVQDVYDEFSGGVFDPNAIRDFLAYTYANWQIPAPLYVLLVGDGNYDFKDNLGIGEPNYIPPFLADVDPWLGEVPADNRFTCISGDDILSDMHLGRLPVKTSVEASDVVAKILSYELNPSPGDWNQHLTFVADNADDAGNFAAISDGIADFYLPTPYSAQKVYYGVTHNTIPDAKNAIIEAINEGRLIANYIGHGSTKFWGTEMFINVNDIPALTNGGRLPFMVPMTCLDGYYHTPSPSGLDNSALAEVIVLAANKGAIASFSPTGNGVATGHDYLNKGLYEAIFSNDVIQVGPATTLAKLYLSANTSFYRDLIDTYLLFGDPATSLNVLPAESSISMSVEPVGAVFPGDTLTYTISYSNTGPATAHHVVVSDVLPSMLLSPTVSSSGASITPQSGSRFIWDIADLEAGEHGTITITAQISSTFNGIITNQASIAISSREMVTVDNQVEPVLTQVDLPTSVVLNSFTASTWPRTILVEWETITDVVDLQGFNLFRSESFEGVRTQLNQEFIFPRPAGIDPFIQYQHLDQQITPGQIYFYWLEMVMDAGAETHGPSTAMATHTLFLPSTSR